MHSNVLTRIAVAVEATPSGRDALALGSTLARATDTDDVMLVGIHVEPLGWDDFEADTRVAVRETGEAFGMDGRVVVEPDALEWRGLRAVVRREHRDLLVVGSGHTAHQGRVRLGRHMKELLEELERPLAVAPSGMREHPRPLRRIGVGFDGRPESRAALTLAVGLAAAADAELVVGGVLDEQLLNDAGTAEVRRSLEGDLTDPPDGLREKVAEQLADDAKSAAREAGIAATVGIERKPIAAPALLELSREVDLMVVGSSRRGPHGRVESGRTGNALLRAASCPVVLTPRPDRRA